MWGEMEAPAKCQRMVGAANTPMVRGLADGLALEDLDRHQLPGLEVTGPIHRPHGTTARDVPEGEPLVEHRVHRPHRVVQA